MLWPASSSTSSMRHSNKDQPVAFRNVFSSLGVMRDPKPTRNRCYGPAAAAAAAFELLDNSSASIWYICIDLQRSMQSALVQTISLSICAASVSVVATMQVSLLLSPLMMTFAMLSAA